MIRVEELLVFDQCVITVVVDSAESHSIDTPSRIVNVSNGGYSAHDERVADYHAGMKGQKRFLVYDTEGLIMDSVVVKHKAPK